MTNRKRAFLFLALFLFTGTVTWSQAVTTAGDTARIRTGQATGQVQTMNNRQARKAGSDNKPDKVKKIQSAKPDMNKARGARPPVIVRPAGTGIPKGIGKPTGVGKKGGR
ncbi:MAG: hypothetical protein RBS37_09055 [Bacteroidales bacterium]|jgi:hypothetical protein|nr:hypothetical protein [Bacteroidales bacterium]